MTNLYDLSNKRVFVAGHRGMVGSAIVRRLSEENCQVLTASREKLDLREQSDVRKWFAREKPDAVFLAAAKVGGILANETSPADFLADNLAIQTNVIDAAFRQDCEKLLFLGSSCIYPKFSAQPIKEEELLTGALEPTNEWYAIAKIAGLKMCQAYRKQHGVDFISAMPTNLYGPGDNYDLERSHVIPALLRKAHEAKQDARPSISVWGSGRPKREFLHVHDAADAMIHLMKTYSAESHINVGSGTDISISELAELVCETVGFAGDVVTDTSKPDGTPRKLLDVTALTQTGWTPQFDLRDGLAHTYEWFRENLSIARLST